MSTIKRKITADKEGFIKLLRDQQDLWADAGTVERIQREKFRMMGRTEGIEWAIRAVEDWKMPQPQTQPTGPDGELIP